MARKFVIANCVNFDGSITTKVILEDLGVGPLIESISKLAGGEKKFETICRELMKIRTEERKKSKFAEKAFSVSNLLSDTITVDTDGSLMFLIPLNGEEMKVFLMTYAKLGKYI